jgi:hypothetical protein
MFVAQLNFVSVPQSVCARRHGQYWLVSGHFVGHQCGVVAAVIFLIEFNTRYVVAATMKTFSRGAQTPVQTASQMP